MLIPMDLFCDVADIGNDWHCTEGRIDAFYCHIEPPPQNRKVVIFCPSRDGAGI